MSKKFKFERIPNCFNHAKRAGLYKLEDERNLIYVCQECKDKLEKTGKLETDSQFPIQLQNEGRTSTGEKLFRSSSIAKVPGGFFWETWKDFGTEESKFLKKSIRRVNGKTKKEIINSKIGEYFHLWCIFNAFENKKTDMIYNSKEYILVEDNGIKYLFFKDGEPFARLGTNMRLEKVYNFKILKTIETK